MSHCLVCDKYTHMLAAKWYGNTYVKVPLCIRCELSLPQNSIDKLLDSVYTSGRYKKETAYVSE